MKVLDVVIIVVSLIIAFGLIIYNVNLDGNTQDLQVVVYVDKEEYYRGPLEQDIIIEVNKENNQGYNVIEVKDNKVSMIEADCKDLVCVRTFPISQSGQVIVCLPHHVYVEIEGEGGSEIDAISN